jgi:hypothetical protein
MEGTEMTHDEFAGLLDDLRVGRFAEAVAMLTPAVLASVKLSVSPRLIPGSELSWIYVARRDRCRQLGHHIPGLGAWVEVLDENPGTEWKLVGISGDDLNGALFIGADGKASALFVSPAPI